MEKSVILSIKGKQSYMDQEPEMIELVTEGTLTFENDTWNICYEESDLTGLAGVTTTFSVIPGRITLTRKGSLNSQMIFEEGTFHESLYELEFGALMITVCASKTEYHLSENGGTIDLVYAIEIENTSTGIITYHLDVQVKP